jgi:hypothetical protein
VYLFLACDSPANAAQRFCSVFVPRSSAIASSSFSVLFGF